MFGMLLVCLFCWLSELFYFCFWFGAFGFWV